MQWPPTRPGLKRQEVPLGAGGLEHLGGVDAELVEDDRQLVHQRDVQVALGVLDHLARLGGLDARAAVHAGLDDALVEAATFSSVSGVSPETTLTIVRQHVLAVAGVDALRAVADEEVALPRRPEYCSSTGMQISSVAPG